MEFELTFLVDSKAGLQNNQFNHPAFACLGGLSQRSEDGLQINTTGRSDTLELNL